MDEGDPNRTWPFDPLDSTSGRKKRTMHPRNSPGAIQQAWDRLTADYTQHTGPVGRRAPLARTELSVILREIYAGRAHDILDAGGGGGYHAVKLAAAGHNVTIVDLSAEMLAVARQRVAQANLKERVECIQGDIRHMDRIPDAAFDVVVACGTVVSDCGDPSAALGEFARVLRPGGKTCVSLRTPRSLDLHGEKDSEHSEPGVVRGHQAFDWHLFDHAGAERVFVEAGLTPLCAVPVGCETPPETDNRRIMAAYVRRHLDLTDDAEALQNAVELMLVARKPAD
ncbi:MAG: class I SAM-dependent methyltransferase [Candidatus Brocadiia bacterium]